MAQKQNSVKGTAHAKIQDMQHQPLVFNKTAVSIAELQKASIAKGFVNGDEILLGDKYSAFKEDIRKGNVGVITPDDIAKSYGNKYFTAQQKEVLGQKLDELVEKGQTQSLTEEECTFLEKACADFQLLERKAIPVKSTAEGAVLGYHEIYVMPTKAPVEA